MSSFFWISLGLFTASYLVFEAQMFLIWKYVSRKSELHTTIIDLINKDTVITHNVFFTLLCVFVSLVTLFEDGTFNDPVSMAAVFVLNLLFNVTQLALYSYYSLGISVRYFLVLKQQTYVSEDWTDYEVRNAARIATYGVPAVITGVRSVVGQHSSFYFTLTGTPRTGGQIGLVTSAVFVLMAVMLNIVCRVLIYFEKRNNGEPSRVDQDHVKTGGAICAVCCLFLILFIVLIVYRNEEQFYAMIQIFGFFATTNLLAFAYMALNPNFLEYYQHRMKPSWDKWKNYRFLRQSKVTPLHNVNQSNNLLH